MFSKPGADLLESWQQALVAYGHGIETVRQGFFNQGDNALAIPGDHCTRQLLPNIFRVRPARVGRGNRSRLIGIMGNVTFGPEIVAQKDHCRPESIHHALVPWVDNGRFQPGFKGHGEKHRGQHRTGGQAKRDIADTQSRGQTELVTHQSQCSQCFAGTLLFGGNGQGQAVNHQVLLWEARGEDCLANPARYGHPAFSGFRNPCLVKRQADQGGTVTFGQGKNLCQAFALAVHRIDQDFAVDGFQSPLQGNGV